jgi:hypothetical protein
MGPCPLHLNDAAASLTAAACSCTRAQVLTSIDTVRIKHVARIRAKREDIVRPFISAAGELWMFSLTDYQIISSYSGFGATSALWSRRWHSQYNIDNKLNTPRPCGALDYDIRDGRNF